MEFALGDRSLLATAEKSLLGSDPLVTQSGDVVCIAPGVSLPLLLRADETRNVQDGSAALKRWKLAGCRFMYGLMHFQPSHGQIDIKLGEFFSRWAETRHDLCRTDYRSPHSTSLANNEPLNSITIRQ